MASIRIPIPGISRLLVVLAVLLGSSLAFAPAAYAHAELLATTPGNGEHLAVAPTEATLKFSERVNLISNGIQVLDRAGQPHNKAKPTVDGDTVRIPLDKDLADGVYTVNWRVVSADSHPVNGAYVFSVGEASAEPLTGPTENSSSATLVADAFWLFRWGAYAGLALLVGGGFFRVVCWPAGYRDRRAHRIVRAGWIVSLVTAVGSLLMQGPNSAGSSIVHAFSPSLLAATVRTDFGISILVRIALIGVIGRLLHWLFAPGTDDPKSAVAGGAAAAGRLSRQQIGVLTGLCVCFVATWSWMGHAHVGENVPLAVAADVAHLSAMAVWVGGLVLLTACVLPHRRAVLSEAARALPRFSVSALVAVAVLVATGLFAAWREVGSLQALSGTEYGKLLIFKLAAFGVLMALAAMSRSTVQRRYVVPVTRASAAQAPPRPKKSGSGSAKSGGGSKKSDAGSTRSDAGSDRADAQAKADGKSKKAQRQQEEQDRAALGALRQSVRLEAGIVAGVLALTAVLVATPPGQVAGAFEAAPIANQPATNLPFSKKIPLSDSGAVQVTLTPARAGDNQLVLAITDAQGQRQDLTGLTAEFTLPARKLGPLPVDLEHLGVGQYTGRSITLPVSGKWKLVIKVRTSEFDQTSVSTDVLIG